MEDIYGAMKTFFNAELPFVLVTVLEKSGSAPREAGTKMIVKQDGSIVGTIGGGILEALSIRHALTCFDSDRCEIRSFSLSNKDASSIGIICGGDIKALFERFGPETLTRNAAVKSAIETEDDFILVTDVTEVEPGIVDGTKVMISKKSILKNSTESVPDFFKTLQNTIDQAVFEIRSFESGMLGIRDYLIDPHRNQEHLCILGGGHVAFELAALSKGLGFYTTIVDDREDFANTTRFPNAEEVRVIKEYSNLLSEIYIHSNSYVVIVTRGHAFDKEVLAQMLRTNAKYIGMIGSRTKRDEIYAKLLNEGFTQADIDRVHCPIGLTIYAQTPAEIAVSIAAELILERRRPKND